MGAFLIVIGVVSAAFGLYLIVDVEARWELLLEHGFSNLEIVLLLVGAAAIAGGCLLQRKKQRSAETPVKYDINYDNIEIDGCWKCACGRINGPSLSYCVCGRVRQNEEAMRSKSAGSGVSKEIAALKYSYQNGNLSKEEFERRKKELLGMQQSNTSEESAKIVVGPSRDLSSTLKELKELFDQGFITQEEYDQKRKQLLGL